jgi:acyl carrier protein phosphodiesterase
MIVQMYESFGNCYESAFRTLTELIPVDEQTEYFSKRFYENKTILRYDDFSIIVQTLSGIGSRIGISIPPESSRTIEMIYQELEGSIAAYFLNEKGRYRKL